MASSSSSINSNTSSHHQVSYNTGISNLANSSTKSRDLICSSNKATASHPLSNQPANHNLLINSKQLVSSHHLITRDPRFTTPHDSLATGFMTCQRGVNGKQLASINKLNEEKQLLEDMKNALNNSSNMNDFENKLKQLRTASLSRSVTKQRFNRFAETIARSGGQHPLQFKTEQQFTKPVMMPSNEHIYESIETGQLAAAQDFYFNQKLNAYSQQNEANLIQTNDDDWSCSTYSTMNGVYDEKPLLLGRSLHSRQAMNENYEADQLQQNLRDLRQASYEQADDQLPDLLLKFKNESYS